VALSSRERAALRAQANHLDATVTVGAGGITPAVVQSLEDAFRSRELVKIYIGRNAAVAARSPKNSDWYAGRCVRRGPSRERGSAW